MNDTKPSLPPCGLYRTHMAIGNAAAGSLVYFHNHGNPGPGIYVPTGWQHNRVLMSKQGQTLSDPTVAHSFTPLPPEGFYRVTDTFHCCEKNCREYEPEMLVQLGYNGKGAAILFQPRMTVHGLALPQKGRTIDDDRFRFLRRVHVPMETPSSDTPIVH